MKQSIFYYSAKITVDNKNVNVVINYLFEKQLGERPVAWCEWVTLPTTHPLLHLSFMQMFENDIFVGLLNGCILHARYTI